MTRHSCALSVSPSASTGSNGFVLTFVSFAAVVKGNWSHNRSSVHWSDRFHLFARQHKRADVKRADVMAARRPSGRTSAPSAQSSRSARLAQWLFDRIQFYPCAQQKRVASCTLPIMVEHVHCGNQYLESTSEVPWPQDQRMPRRR